MPTLDQLQSLMSSAMRGGDALDLLTLIEGDGVPPEALLRIYRNHMTMTLTEALEATFPVVCRLVDQRFFAYAAHEYIAATPPSRPCLAEFGESFPDFLASFPACRNLVYLADVARLEWAINLALHAEEARLDRPASISSGSVVRLHPSSHLVASQWPIERIWYANQPEGNPNTIIELDSGGARLQVYRRGDRVVIREVEQSTYAFLSALAQGARVREAIEAGKHSAATFDPTADLDFLFEEGLIVGPAFATPPLSRPYSDGHSAVALRCIPLR
jgi:hypothetical protein